MKEYIKIYSSIYLLLVKYNIKKIYIYIYIYKVYINRHSIRFYGQSKLAIRRILLKGLGILKPPTLLSIINSDSIYIYKN